MPLVDDPDDFSSLPQADEEGCVALISLPFGFQGGNADKLVAVHSPKQIGGPVETDGQREIAVRGDHAVDFRATRSSFSLTIPTRPTT